MKKFAMRLYCADCRLSRVFQWSGHGRDLHQACPRCGKTNIVQGIGKKPMGFPYQERRARVRTEV